MVKSVYNIKNMEEIHFDKRFRKACDNIIELASRMNVAGQYKESVFKDISRICLAQLKKGIIYKVTLKPSK